MISEQTDGEWHISVEQVIETPVLMSLLLGDAIHNYRTALDHLMADLVLGNSEGVTHTTQFPTGKDYHAFSSSLGEVSGQLGSVTESELETQAPYPSGAWENLYFIHVFDIADKHNMLIPSISSATIRNVAANGRVSCPVYRMYFDAGWSEGLILWSTEKPTFDSAVEVEMHIANAPFFSGVPVVKVLEKFRKSTTEAIDYFDNKSRFPSR